MVGKNKPKQEPNLHEQTVKKSVNAANGDLGRVVETVAENVEVGLAYLELQSKSVEIVSGSEYSFCSKKSRRRY